MAVGCGFFEVGDDSYGRGRLSRVGHEMMSNLRIAT